MHNYQRLSTWSVSFLLEWLLPKALTGLVAFTLCRFAFAALPTGDLPDAARKPFDAIFAVTLNPYYVPVVWAIGVVFLVGLACRQLSSGKSRSILLYLADRSVPKLAWLLNAGFGLLLVPMVVAASAFSLFPHDYSRQLHALEFTAIALVVFGGGFHFLGGYDGHPRHQVGYSVSSISETDPDIFYENTRDRLSDVLSHVPWHGGPEAVAESADRSICLLVPLYLDYGSWNQQELRALNRYLSAIELEWHERGYSFVRLHLSPIPNPALAEGAA